jgi:formylglycine-generating enzyme required for sulfatase activity
MPKRTHGDLPDFVTENEARQFVTAGGKDQRVKDGGPKGYSYFTGFLLEGLTEGKADLYPDGYITFAELAAYLIPRATNAYQTPVSGILPQHGQGQFVFRSPRGSRIGRTLTEKAPRKGQAELKGDQEPPPKPPQDLDAILAKLRARLATRASPSLGAKTEEHIKPQEKPAPKADTLRQQSGTFKDCDFCPQMVRLPGGCFQMGSPESETGRDDDERQHQVCVDDFALGKYEVTFAEYDRFAEATGRKKPSDTGWGRGRRPVINVSWEDAVDYADWLSRETGKRYRLPTEAEWEYAARGGTTTTRFWGDDPSRACQYANVKDRTAKEYYSRWSNIHECRDGYVHTAPVGAFKPNKYELYDVLGNVWEWTCSEYDESYSGKEQKCISKKHAGRRVLRGGSWIDLPRNLRSAARFWFLPVNWNFYVGFRLAQD